MRFSGSLCVLAAILWCALWFAGRGEIDARLDGELARIAERSGLEIEVGARSIDGFPFAYAAEFRDVRLADAGSGARSAIPALRTSVDVTAPGRIVTELPARLTLSLPVEPALRRRYPALPERIELAIESEGLEIAAEPRGDGELALSLTAARLAVAPAAATPGLDFSAELSRVSGAVSLGGPAGEDGVRGRARLSAGTADIGIDAETPEGRLAVEALLEAAALSGETTAGTLPAIRRLLRGSPGDTGRASLVARKAEGAVETAGGAADGRIDLAAQALSARLRVAGGGVSAGASTDRARLALAPAAAGNPLSGAVAADGLALDAAAPLQPGPMMRRLALSAEIEGLAPEPALWSRLDPAGRLPREAGRLALALEGEGRLRRPTGQRAPGAPPPLELGRLAIERLELDALGAAARGDGALTFTRPEQHPRGEVSLRLSGALALIRRLSAAALIDETTVQTLATMAAFYTRAGDGPDELAIDLAFREDGLHVNGEPAH
jgi:hypothetical protein